MNSASLILLFHVFGLSWLYFWLMDHPILAHRSPFWPYLSAHNFCPILASISPLFLDFILRISSEMLPPGGQLEEWLEDKGESSFYRARRGKGGGALRSCGVKQRRANQRAEAEVTLPPFLLFLLLRSSGGYKSSWAQNSGSVLGLSSPSQEQGK